MGEKSVGKNIMTFTLEESETPVHPLMKLAGIVNSDTPDLAERHDFYLAEEGMNTHADED